MKQAFYHIFFLICAVIGFASCSTIEQVISPQAYKSRTIDFYERPITKEAVYQKPLVADLDVSAQKLSFSRSYEKISTDEAKDFVTAEFAMGQNCDVIVHPVYETVVTNTDGLVKVEVTITGYPAFYKNIRNYEPDDTEAWMIYSYYNPGAEEKKNSGKPEKNKSGTSSGILQILN